MYYIVKFLVRLYFRMMYKISIEGRENTAKRAVNVEVAAFILVNEKVFL